MVQGRETSPSDIEMVRRLIASNPSWNRTRLSRELCALWDWRAPDGRLKDMAARSFLLKLEDGGLITLPPRQRHYRGAKTVAKPVLHSTDPISCELGDLAPVRVEPVEGASEAALFKCLLSEYHYLGYHAVGKNMAYMAFDRLMRPLACLLFGSAAWKCAPRDVFIGWEAEVREANLNMITGNTRFLVLPWVEVPHLASHVLGQLARRVSSDWENKYGHPVFLLETFVESERFAGTCYRAANWIRLGQTKGRSRNDAHTNMSVPVKDVYVYPLAKRFREALCA